MEDVTNALAAASFANNLTGGGAIINDKQQAEKVNKRGSLVSGGLSGMLGLIFGIINFGPLVGIAIGVGSFVVGGAVSYGLGKLRNWIIFGEEQDISIPVSSNHRETNQAQNIEISQENLQNKEKQNNTELATKPNTSLKELQNSKSLSK